MSMANDLRGLIVGGLVGAGIAAHVLVGWPRETPATRESGGPMVRAGQSGPAQASASDAQSTGPDLDDEGQEFATKGPESAPKGPDLEAPMHTLDDLFLAIAEVETGGEPNPDRAVGDKGKSFGRYQIGLLYYMDAWYRHPEDVDRGSLMRALPVYMSDPEKARQTMVRYWRRYCPAALEAGDWETLARYHGCGATSAREGNGHEYAAKVLKAMGGGR